MSYCVQVLIHNENLISLYEITTSPVCWYLFKLSCSTVFLSVMCIMISGILITAKCHMHVSQSWDLYTGRKTNTENFIKVFKKKLKKKIEKKRMKIETDASEVWCITAELNLWKCFVCFLEHRWPFVCVKVVILAKNQ